MNRGTQTVKNNKRVSVHVGYSGISIATILYAKAKKNYEASAVKLKIVRSFTRPYELQCLQRTFR